MCVGTALSLNLASVAKKGGTAACNAIANLASKELTSAGTNVIAAKVSKSFTWFSSNCARRTTISQTAQKSLQSAEGSVIKDGVQRVKFDLDALSKAASVTGCGSLTLAGRSLTKHGTGARPGNSLFPAAKGHPKAINFTAQKIVDDILTTPRSVIQNSYRGRFGNTIEVSTPDGRGLVYNNHGKFLFFKE